MTVYTRYFFLSAITNGLYLALAFFSLNLFDRAIATGSIPNLALLAVILLLLLVLLFVAEFERKTFLDKKRHQISKLVRFRYRKLPGLVTLKDDENFELIASFYDREIQKDSALLAIYDLPWILIYSIILTIFSPFIILFVLVSNLVLFGIKYFSSLPTGKQQTVKDEPYFRHRGQLERLPARSATTSLSGSAWAAMSDAASTGIPSIVTTFAALLVVTNHISVGTLIVVGILSQRIGTTLIKLPQVHRAHKRRKFYEEFFKTLRKTRPIKVPGYSPTPEKAEFNIKSIIGPAGESAENIVQLKGLSFSGPLVSVVGATNSTDLARIFDLISGGLPLSHRDVNLDGRPIDSYSVRSAAKRLFILDQRLSFLSDRQHKFSDLLGVYDHRALASIIRDLQLQQKVPNLSQLTHGNVREVSRLISETDVRALYLAASFLRGFSVYLLFEPLFGLSKTQKTFVSRLISLNVAKRNSIVLIFTVNPEELAVADFYLFKDCSLQRTSLSGGSGSESVAQVAS